jgi:hypothetical protein
MAQGLQMRCHCCGAEFIAFNSSARWCSSRCAMRAYYRRRNGKPEADPRYQSRVARQQALHPALVAADDAPELPALWASPEPAYGTEQRFWQGTAIQRRDADGFVNATAMCQANGRRWAKYAESERAREYMQALAAVVPNSDFGIVQAQRGGIAGGGGTWVHPSLAIDLARWISPAFAVWMDGWFLESLTRPQQPQRPAYSGTGVYVVAPTQREACTIWRDAVQDAVNSAIAGRFSPEHRTECGLKTLNTTAYSWVLSR